MSCWPERSGFWVAWALTPPPLPSHILDRKFRPRPERYHLVVIVVGVGRMTTAAGGSLTHYWAPHSEEREAAGTAGLTPPASLSTGFNIRLTLTCKLSRILCTRYSRRLTKHFDLSANSINLSITGSLFSYRCDIPDIPCKSNKLVSTEVYPASSTYKIKLSPLSNCLRLYFQLTGSPWYLTSHELHHVTK